MSAAPDWLHIERGSAPLLLSIPHAGIDLRHLENQFVSPWLARKDADWHVPQLYSFARELGATLVWTDISRSVIDVNRDPSGKSLYPGQATTDLCPITTFDGEPLYREGASPSAQEIEDRRERYFNPYHAALNTEIARLQEQHPHVVIYDCHSIRSIVPRLFEGTLPQLNIGTNDGKSCAPELANDLRLSCAASAFNFILNGRFKGGYITRHFGQTDRRVHAIQMELAMRGYLREEPGEVTEKNWPLPLEPTYAAPMRNVLRDILERCISFAQRQI